MLGAVVGVQVLHLLATSTLPVMAAATLTLLQVQPQQSLSNGVSSPGTLSLLSTLLKAK